MDAQPALVRPLFASPFDAQVALWVSRLSLHYPAVLKQFNQGLFSEELRQLVGVAPRDDRVSKAGLRQLLKTRVAEFERDLAGCRSLLTRNIGMLAELVELDDVQQDILAFAAMAQQHAVLCDTIDDIASNSTDAVVRLLSTALGHREADIARALQADSPLISTRIVTIEHGDIGRGIRPVVPRSLVSALFSAADSITSLMSAFLEPAPRPTLTAESFVHLDKETDLLTTYLAKARSRGIRGINILIYGPPGTGKTEYVRWLATRLRRRLYQVRAEDDQGKAITGVDRLTFFQFSQHFLQSSSAIILFDEIEDVFPNADNIVDALMNRRAGALGKLLLTRAEN
jgi:hypothetical protein